MDTSMEKMAKLAPAFRKDGTVNAGNSSGLMSREPRWCLCPEIKPKSWLKPMATLRAWLRRDRPKYMGLGPVPAVRKVFQKDRDHQQDLDVIEAQ